MESFVHSLLDLLSFESYTPWTLEMVKFPIPHRRIHYIYRDAIKQANASNIVVLFHFMEDCLYINAVVGIPPQWLVRAFSSINMCPLVRCYFWVEALRNQYMIWYGIGGIGWKWVINAWHMPSCHWNMALEMPRILPSLTNSECKSKAIDWRDTSWGPYRTDLKSLMRSLNPNLSVDFHPFSSKFAGQYHKIKKC
jgi:hypothetical protein